MDIQLKVLAAAVGVALGASQVTHAATITVDSLDDEFIISGRTDCVLRLAVIAANDNRAQAGCVAGDEEGVDQIVFDPSLSGGTITLTQGQMLIRSSVTIDAGVQPGAGITVSAASASRIFRITNFYDYRMSQVTLRGLTLRDGYVNGDGGAIINEGKDLRVENCTISGNSATSVGGGILNRGQTTVQDSIVSQNSASLSGGGLGSSDGTLSIINTTLTGNSTQTGGGLSSFGSGTTLSISGGVISGNSASVSGGGVWTSIETDITGATFESNQAQTGGGLYVAGNTSTVNNSTLSANTATYNFGGAIALVNGAEVTVNSSVLLDNLAERGGGAAYTSGILVLNESTVEANTAGVDGGGIVVRLDGNLNISGGSLLRNYASNGGAIKTDISGSLTMDGGSLRDNIATFGGGIYNTGTASLDEVVIAGNSASYEGGGVFQYGEFLISRSAITANSARNGSAIYSRSYRILTLENVTLSGNSQTTSGNSSYPAALYVRSPIAVSNSTIFNNAPNGVTKIPGDTFTMTNTIIAGSAVSDCVDGETPLTINVNNWIEDGSCAVGALGLTTGPLVLEPLSDVGGSTLVHPLSPGSPVIDAGDNNTCTGVDQTGMPRPIDGNSDGDADCDMGSVEYVDLTGPLSVLSAGPDVTSPGAGSFELTVTYTELDGLVDFTSIDGNDLSVLPGPLVIQDADLAGSASQLVVTYQLTPPGGEWDFSDSGTYTVSINPDEITDNAVTGVNAVIAGEIGSFQVEINEVDVSGNDLSIADGDDTPASADGTDFGQVVLGRSATRTFTVTNVGSGTLTLSAPVEVLGQGFSVSQPATTVLNQGESTTVEVVFSPASAGSVIGVLTIANDDFDESIYSFSLTARGVVPAEVIFADGFETQ